ncbi:MAG TPA: nucleotidyltransferase family protein [Blastocatellia bacterium]|nr:nucleotidyltransferase family protein [Blastocatellia bacterium]
MKARLMEGPHRTFTTPHRATQKHGELVARMLFGAWRLNPPELETCEEEIEAVTPQLLGSGAGALGWRRITSSQFRTSPAAFKLQQAYRLQTLYAGLHEVEIEQVIKTLAAEEIEPLLIKGRVAAALYPELGLRPYGDIDICFDSGHYKIAASILNAQGDKGSGVDMHDGFEAVYGLSFDEVFERATTIKVGKVMVRVPCFEDHLRILCIHFLKHGGWRPLSLCDIAAALEAQEDIDWDRCLGGDKRIINWVSCTIGLAHELLGARVSNIPVLTGAKKLPRWLAAAVLRQWASPYPLANETPEFFKLNLREPAQLKSEIQKRWPNPIKATMYFVGSFNELPRLPFQLGNFISLGLRALGRFPRHW